MAVSFNERAVDAESCGMNAYRQRLLTDARAKGTLLDRRRREPVLDSEHDARKRICVVTSKLFGTTAIKGAPVCRPPSGKNIRSGKPVRGTRAHSPVAVVNPQDG